MCATFPEIYALQFIKILSVVIKTRFSCIIEYSSMEQLMKTLHIYFSYLNKHNLKWNNCIKKASKPLSALCNQAEQLRLVRKFEDNEDSVELPNIKSRLISKIKFGVEEELSLLKEILKECEASNKELKNKLVAVEQSCDAVETEAILRGTATHPAPCLMVEWAQDAWRLYHTFYIQISGALRCLKYEDEDSVVRFQKAFQEDAKMKCDIQRISAYTQFFIEGL